MTLAVLALAALPFVVSPGASFAITVDVASTGDRRGALKVWMGTALGISAIATLFALSGIGLLLAANSTARTAFGLLGGGVLVLLGFLSIVKAIRSARSSVTSPRPPRKLVLWSFLALITNVKALSLYALVVPALHTPHLAGTALFFTFAGVHVVMLFLWLTVLAWAVRRIPNLGASPRIRTALMSAAALTLIALGSQTVIKALP
ncbi:LysE family translocator [Curtobacterium sp. MCPF17_031]|uniref:LysE family translocator n=1 Tax=Curtobacterium sp. MCPF17_031 TaxID=2175653 RepID=UPI000DA81FAB|nr:LysE family transporter [Curtobacterium sp. MCPF17_031]PZE33333.1 hypothetical protein DEJ31_16440 [Curtobacterium sp. MCPF17_031]